MGLRPRSEIRTPLHQIKNLTSLLRTTLVEGTHHGGNDALTLVDRLEESADQLENTMVNLLGFFRSDQETGSGDKPEHNPERKTVQEALQETVDLCLLKERLARRSRSEGSFYPDIVVDISKPFSLDCSCHIHSDRTLTYPV
jgi:signal transduction histidine kinase